MGKLKKGAELLHSFEIWVKDQGKSDSTVTTYKSAMQKFYQWLMNEKDISDLTNKDIQRYMDFLDQENRSASTIDKVFATIRVFAQFLNQPELVHDIKKKEKERNIYQTIPDVLDESVKRNVLKKVKEDGNFRNTAIVYTLLYTGIRISELCALNHDDIEMKEQKGIVIVRNTQGETDRVIPLSPKAIPYLKRYMESLKITKGPLFVSNSTERLSTRAVQYMLKNYNINPIQLRHTFCQGLIDRGVDTSTVMRLTGHSDINMIKRYKKDSIKNEADLGLA